MIDKYGIEPTTLHEKESFKDCIMSKLKYAKEIDFKTAVRVCRPMAESKGMNFEAQNKKFYRTMFSELLTLEKATFIIIEWEDNPDREGKQKVKSIRLDKKGEEWLSKNDFKE